MNLIKYYNIKGDIKIKKNEVIFVKKGEVKSKDEKYFKIILEKGEVF